MDIEEMGKKSLIFMEDYWIRTGFSLGGLKNIDTELMKISKGTGIPIEKLRKYAAELMRRLIMRFDPDQTLPKILGDEEMGTLSLIFVENYWITTAFSLGGLKNMNPEFEKISKATGIPLKELREYASELRKRLIMRFAKHPDQIVRRLLDKDK